MGLNVAMWTVDSKANYLKYGNMGVYMMTCNSLKPSEMPDLEDIDWGTGALDQPSADGVTVKSTDHYTITGRNLGNSVAADGICITVRHLSDGTTQTDKTYTTP